MGPLTAHDHPGAFGVDGQVDQVRELSDLGTVTQFAVGVDGGQPIQAGDDCAPDRSVIATPMEKKLRTPCSRKLRIWSRKPWLAPAESVRIRMSLPWRWASGICAKAKSNTVM